MKAFIKRCIPAPVRKKLSAMYHQSRAGKSVGREEMIRKDITKEQIGLEIGPSHHPIVSKKDGYRVETVDWLDQQGLKEHYKGHGVDTDAIEEVDYVWHGGSYSRLIGKKDYYDYIVASHMIEHTTDFLGFLKDCSALLKEDGILRLAVPDKRFCFDHYRDVTGLAEVINNYYEPSTLQSVGSVAEYHLNVVKYKDNISWRRPDGMENSSDKHYTFVHSVDYAKHIMRLVKDEKEYQDIHHYVFTPLSFELLIMDLRLLELLDLEIVEMTETEGNEFVVTMKKSAEQYTVDPEYRKQLLKRRNKENRI